MSIIIIIIQKCFFISEIILVRKTSIVNTNLYNIADERARARKRTGALVT